MIFPKEGEGSREGLCGPIMWIRGTGPNWSLRISKVKTLKETKEDTFWKLNDLASRETIKDKTQQFYGLI